MNITPASAIGSEARLQSRSMGLKLLIIGTLALLMTIPSLFVRSVLDDRAGRAAAVVRDVSNQVGGPQTFLGSVLPPRGRISTDAKSQSYPSRPRFVLRSGLVESFVAERNSQKDDK